MPRQYNFFVYILANKRNSTLYTGFTNNLERRVWEHKNDINEGFTKRYSVHNLVYYEVHQNIFEAQKRELQIKKWSRSWKLELIESENPDWKDLSEQWK